MYIKKVLRFIPTRVGKSSIKGEGTQMIAVHPHACGEVVKNDINIAPMLGSSPRVWGSPVILTVQKTTARFIPTRVGKSSPPFLQQHSASVHPHACGEVPLPEMKKASKDGSSPRVWGSRVDTPDIPKDMRFIPTRVGKSEAALGTTAIGAVHPHACGEVTGTTDAERIFIGSSPRVWGSPNKNAFRKLGERFIPTRVGKSWASFDAHGRPTVHPHACGEVKIGNDLFFFDSGSSPRVWGSRVPVWTKK